MSRFYTLNILVSAVAGLLLVSCGGSEEAADALSDGLNGSSNPPLTSHLTPPPSTGSSNSLGGEVKLSEFWSEFEGCSLCHGAGGDESAGPDLSTPAQFVANLVGKGQSSYPNWRVDSNCSQSLPFIQAGNAAQSTLLAALVQESSDSLLASRGCISSYNLHTVTQSTLEGRTTLINQITDWINAGAKNN